MKILNLYAGLGGNRRMWGSEHDITAVELNPEVAGIYKSLYPTDTVIVGDAHMYLEKHFNEFDFIWTSPPCQSHSSMRKNIATRYRGTPPVFPDFRLYEEVVFLQSYIEDSKTKWVVENVKPYYTPLIKPVVSLQRHLFWANFRIKEKAFKNENLRSNQIKDLQQIHGIDLTDVKLKNKRQCLRNCVLPQLGLHILNCAEWEKEGERKW